MPVEIERLGTATYSLGEGPVWDPIEQVLYFVDIGAWFHNGSAFHARPAIYRYDPRTGYLHDWPLPTGVGSLALRDGGDAILACADGFHAFDFATGERTPIGNPQAGRPDTVFNDGKVDRQGRFVGGTITSASSGRGLGVVYRLDHDLTWQAIDTGLDIVNGPCWSPDGRHFYISDTMHSTIFVADYDIEAGTIANRRVFATTEALGGMPDGATVDADGFLWSAIVTGGRLARFTPDGRVDRVVELPVDWVTSMTFGGPTLDIVYVTSLNPTIYDAPGRGPDEGGLFAVHGLGVRGLPEPRFRG